MAERLPKVLGDVEPLLRVLQVVHEEQFVVGFVELDELRDELKVVRDKRQPAIRRREEVLVQRVCNHELNGMQLRQLAGCMDSMER